MKNVIRGITNIVTITSTDHNLDYHFYLHLMNTTNINQQWYDSFIIVNSRDKEIEIVLNLTLQMR